MESILSQAPEWFVHAVMLSFFHASIGFLVGAVATAFLFLAKRRVPYRWAWNVTDPGSTVFVLATSAKKDTGVYYRYASGMGQIRALSILAPTFLRAYGTFDASNVLLSQEASAGLYGHDIIILGGPKNNHFTVEFLKQLPECPYTMEVNDIIDKQSNTRLTGVAEERKIVMDYGLIIKTRNPFDRRKRCFLFVSTHTYGLQAAAVAFAEELSKLKYARHQTYACLVSSAVHQHFVGKPKLISFRPFSNHEPTTLSMKIIEQNVVGKEGNPELCEDALAITDRYIAVIDGATAKGAFLINGQSPGRAIAQALRAFLVEYNSDSSGVDLIQIMTDYVNSTLVRPSGDRAVNENTPSASIAVYTRHHKRITIIGDIQFLINGSGRLKRKKIDQLLGSARALYLRMLLAKGIGVDHFETDDPGREVILPLLRMQYLLRNNKAFDEWAYGDIDGHSFDPTFVDSIAVNDGDEIVLCSDGYPALLPTLEKAELALQQVLKTDPLRVRQPDTKGIRKGNLSYDDRTYIRFLA